MTFCKPVSLYYQTILTHLSSKFLSVTVTSSYKLRNRGPRNVTISTIILKVIQMFSFSSTANAELTAQNLEITHLERTLGPV